MFRILAYGATHVGRERKNNEDAFRISPESGLYLVCDGMGGHASGEIASQIAADAMVHFVGQDLHRPDLRWPIDTPNGLPEESRILDAAVRVANSEVFSAAAVNPLHKGMGTTVVGVIAGPQRLGLVHVGDSRIYRLRGGELTQLTEDHSLLNFYIQTRPMSAEQIKQFSGKNVIVRAVGLRDAVEPDVQIQDYRTGDLYLLCTDGVTDMVDDNIIAATLEECGDRLTQTAERLIDHALNGGGKDNITVVLLQVVEVAEESRARHSARSTLTMDTDDMPVVHDELEDTSPGFALNPADPSDAETLTEVEVRQSTVVRKQHAQTQEVPYRPWQQTELNAPPKPGVPLPFRREMARQVQISNDMPVDVVAPTEPSRLGLGLSRSLAPATRDSDDLPVDTAAATEPHGSPLPAFAHDQPRRAALATTAKHPVVRDSQPLPDLDRALRSAPLVSAPSLVVGAGPGGQPADEHAVTTDLAAARAQAAKPVLRVRVDGMPYKSGGTEAEMIAPVVVEDTERVDSQARAAEVAEARRSAETAIAPESSEKAQLRITAVGKPNPRKLSTPEPLATQVEAAPTVNLVISGSIPKIYVASTPPPRPDRLTTMNSQAVPEGLPLDDDEDEA